MDTQKWHFLHHICDAFWKVGDLTYLPAENFESSHKHLKRRCILSFEKTRTLMKEYITKIEKGPFLESHSKVEKKHFEIKTRLESWLLKRMVLIF